MMTGKIGLVPFVVLVGVICANAAFVLPDTSIFRHCLGPACPAYSLPMKVEKAGVQHALNCTKGEFIPHSTECQSFYICKKNGTAIKMTCTFGYAFHPRIKMCVPETIVKSCGKVYCPPSILIGMVPDPLNCTRYYKCVYGVPMHFQCEPEYVYDEELGKCMEYGDNVPACLAEGENISSGNTTTESSTTTHAPNINSTVIDGIVTTENSIMISTASDVDPVAN